MPVNPLISDKIKRLECPDTIKEILTEILDMESRLEVRDEKKSAVPSISKILAKYADDDGIVEACSGHVKHQ